MYRCLTIYITNHGFVYKITSNEVRREVLEETGMGWLVIGKYYCYKGSFLSHNSFLRKTNCDMNLYIKSREKKNKMLKLLKDILDVI